MIFRLLDLSARRGSILMLLGTWSDRSRTFFGGASCVLFLFLGLSTGRLLGLCNTSGDLLDFLGVVVLSLTLSSLGSAVTFEQLIDAGGSAAILRRLLFPSCWACLLIDSLIELIKVL